MAGELVGKYFIMGLTYSQHPLRVIKIGDSVQITEDSKPRYEVAYQDRATPSNRLLSVAALDRLAAEAKANEGHLQPLGVGAYMLEIQESEVPQALIDTANLKFNVPRP